MGAGGSTIALTWHLAQTARGVDRPSRIVVSNRSPARLEHLAAIHARLGHGIPVDCVLAPGPQDNDAVLARLSPGALVINATGLGKDAPGSPLTDAARFPERAIAWDLNYRGDRPRAGGRAGAPGRGRLDLLHPRLDAGHRRGLRRAPPRPRPRLRRDRGHRRPRHRPHRMSGRILVTPRSLSKGGHAA
ncbi:MAG: hypothetical protein MUF63_17700 [Rhodobacteraceae bacterium]|nr:hypothetical protein [Paracoccaceae bacterium]